MEWLIFLLFWMFFREDEEVSPPEYDSDGEWIIETEEF